LNKTVRSRSLFRLLLVFFVQVGKLPPRIKVVPKVVELVDLVNCRPFVSEERHVAVVRPAAVALEHWTEDFIETFPVRNTSPQTFFSNSLTNDNKKRAATQTYRELLHILKMHTLLSDKYYTCVRLRPNQGCITCGHGHTRSSIIIYVDVHM